MRISEAVRTTSNQDGAVLLDVSQGLVFSLNPVGTIIWQHLSDGRAHEEIADRLVGEFGIERDQALNDLKVFLQQLEQRRLMLPPCLESSENAEAVRTTGLIGALGRWRKRFPRGNCTPLDKPGES